MANNRAVRLHGYGGPDTVTVDDVAVPQPGPQQVLVRVAVAGMNPFDRKLRSGALRDQFPLTLPVTLGAEVAGTVEALGGGATGLTVGRRVVAWTGNLGAYARLVASGEIRATVGRTVAFEDAAAGIEQLGAGAVGKTVLQVR